jgi:hypothetical protein
VIYYRPTDGDPLTSSAPCRPRTCFLMTQLGKPVPEEIRRIRALLERTLARRDFGMVDANSVVTGRDFLHKIWELVVSVPVGIAILHEEMTTRTVANIFYELGLLQAYGKETLVIKTGGTRIPSDFVRTEYVEFTGSEEEFARDLDGFMDTVDRKAEYCSHIADQLERNPLLSIDYLRRAYLITGDEAIQERVSGFVRSGGLASRAKNSVEMLAATFVKVG